MCNCQTTGFICLPVTRSGVLTQDLNDGLTYQLVCAPTTPAGQGCEITAAVAGYLELYREDRGLSAPIRFTIQSAAILPDVIGPGCVTASFCTRKYRCHAEPVYLGSHLTAVRLVIRIVAMMSFRWCPACPGMPASDSCCGCKIVEFETTLLHPLHMTAAIQQYSTLAKGTRRIYTNEDELTEYGTTGIVPPAANTIERLFANGVLQPTANYHLSPGLLKLLTADTPHPGAPLILSLIAFTTGYCDTIDVTSDTYVTRSTPGKRVYRDADAAGEYGLQTLPDPDSVSYYTLYINGALQPPVNYQLRRGSLELTTDDLPPEGAPIILEYHVIKNACGKRLDAEVYSYNARANGGKVYTDRDELAGYDGHGIPDPALYSYVLLYVNGVLQPPVNYTVEKGQLRLDTLDAPTPNALITLQYVCVFTG